MVRVHVPRPSPPHNPAPLPTPGDREKGRFLLSLPCTLLCGSGPGHSDTHLPPVRGPPRPDHPQTPHPTPGPRAPGRVYYLVVNVATKKYSSRTPSDHHRSPGRTKRRDLRRRHPPSRRDGNPPRPRNPSRRRSYWWSRRHYHRTSGSWKNQSRSRRCKTIGYF